MAHVIEPAKSGRASCRTCRKAIAKGELRLGEETVNQFAGDGDTSYRWHHLTCAAGAVPDALAAALGGYQGEVPDRAGLEARMAEGKKKTKPAAFPYVERAPSGRSRCMFCDATIAKGDLRVAVEREVDTGSFVTRGAGYLHPACASEQLDRDGTDLEPFVAGLKANSRVPAEEVDQVLAEL